MNIKDINIDDILYWNTTGAYNSNISLKCKVFDIGKNYVWVMVNGNIGHTPIDPSKLTKEPLYKVTNPHIISW